MTDIARLLERSSLIQAAAALEALRAGWQAASPRPCNVEELRRIYKIRAEWVRKLIGPHMAQLSVSLDEFVANLATAEDAAMTDIRGPADHHFLVVVSIARNIVLGCLKVVPNPDAALNLNIANGKRTV